MYVCEWRVDLFTAVLTFDDSQAEDEESSLPHMNGGMFQSKLPPGILPHGLPQVKEVQPAVTSLEQEQASKPPAKQVRELSEEEKQMIILTEDFQRFFDRAARVMERALSESIDIYTDYTGINDGEEGGFNPNLILGGTYSGQIVLWDNRVQKRTPIQRTPLSAAAHTHPVYCMNVVGTQNAHNLISISTDGRLCSWSLDMLSQPQDTLELQYKQSKAIAVTCLAFPHNDVNNFVVGSEEGSVYTACRHGSKAGVTETYDGHQGPVTGISTHAVQGGIDFSHLFLTSSFDWTVKLWSLKPLYSFEDNGDYVYDVAWSPIHPALFATVDGTGRLDLWNLNQETEVPVASVIVEGASALNRVSWTPSGLHVTVGDDMGKIWVYDVGEQLAQPRHDEWNKFVYTLQELKNNQADEEIDKLNLGSGPGSLSSLSSLSSTPLR
uniref:Cytoplasmic dynein 1 intermediate chain, DH IC n=1 Tax=Timema cristinae TaxID=61476 RepID=A0A7R9CDB7_TIMCR|nr:unnamed protein product [Timema cristinae]